MDTEISLLKVNEVGARLGMSRSAIYREIHGGRLVAFKIGKSLRISSDEVSRYIENLTAVTSAVAGGE
jgi:excisionase family DNA binding protein